MKRRALLFCLCLTLSLACLPGLGHPLSHADTIPMPEKILKLPSWVSHEGDRVGPWGLPTLVAMRYGLTVNERHDDRLSETASRKAAMQYLNDLYELFGDWDQCLVAYLYSPAYVRNLQARHRDALIEGFDEQRYTELKLVEQAQRAELVRKAEAARRQAAATTPPVQPKYVTYTVKRGDTLGKIAQKYHVKVKDIKKWNNLKSDLIRENDKLKIYP